MADLDQNQSFTTEDEENNTDYSTQPEDAIQADQNVDGVVEKDIYEESPVGDMDTNEIADTLAEQEEDQAEDFIKTGE